MLWSVQGRGSCPSSRRIAQREGGSRSVRPALNCTRGPSGKQLPTAVGWPASSSSRSARADSHRPASRARAQQPAGQARADSCHRSSAQRTRSREGAQGPATSDACGELGRARVAATGLCHDAPSPVRDGLLVATEFSRHGGDIKRAMHALAKDRLDAIPDASREHVQMSVKKRKWDRDRDDDGARPTKAVRTLASPAKTTSKPSGIPGRATPKTPGRILGRGPPAFGSPMVSPSKLMGPGKRPPSTAQFNPLLPKTPAFPARSAVLRRQPSFAIQPASSGSGAKEAMALVSVPTKDGQVIELDPLSASPSAIDRLEGISDSAKKHAKDEMSRLVHGALSKWRIA